MQCTPVEYPNDPVLAQMSGRLSGRIRSKLDKGRGHERTEKLPRNRNAKSDATGHQNAKRMSSHQAEERSAARDEEFKVRLGDSGGGGGSSCWCLGCWLLAVGRNQLATNCM